MCANVRLEGTEFARNKNDQERNCEIVGQIPLYVLNKIPRYRVMSDV
jgi:hypothetical protein